MTKQTTNAKGTVKSGGSGETVKKYLFAILLSFVIAGIIAALFGYNPFLMFLNLFKGAWVGKLNFGTTLEKLTTTLLLATAFNLCTKVQYFNLGLEGSMYLGALGYAVIGYQFPNLPGYIYLPLCILVAMVIGGIWGVIPAYLKTKWNVNEVCVNLLMNYVTINFCTYAIYYVWTAKTSIPQTPELCPQVQIPKIMLPSRANVGLFIAIAVFALTAFVIYRTQLGFKVKMVGQNSGFAEYMGLDVTKMILRTAFISGAIAGLAGGLEVGGLYGRFVDEFAAGASFNGLLASRLVGNNLLLLPISSFALSTLLAGAFGVERSMGIQRAFIDCFTAIIIMTVTMEDLKPFCGRCVQNVRKFFSGKKKVAEAKEEQQS